MRQPWARLLPDYLKPAGYRSYHSGKWHIDGKVLAGGFDRSLRAVLLSLFVRHKLFMLASTENAKDLNELRDLIETGQVTPSVDRTYPLSEATDAIRYVSEGRARGKVVITL